LVAVDSGVIHQNIQWFRKLLIAGFDNCGRRVPLPNIAIDGETRVGGAGPSMIGGIRDVANDVIPSSATHLPKTRTYAPPDAPVTIAGFLA